VPLVLAALVYAVMYIWHLGAAALVARLQEQTVPVDAFMVQIADGHVPRVPGTAVFLTRTQRDAPPAMVWHVKHNRALHERVLHHANTPIGMPRDATCSAISRATTIVSGSTPPVGYITPSRQRRYPHNPVSTLPGEGHSLKRRGRGRSLDGSNRLARAACGHLKMRSADLAACRGRSQEACKYQGFSWSRSASRGPGSVPHSPGRLGIGMVCPVCACAAVAAIARPPAAVAVNTLRREMFIMTLPRFDNSRLRTSRSAVDPFSESSHYGPTRHRQETTFSFFGDGC
jgi:hypothetical protein